MDENKTGKSTFFELDENVAAVFVATLPLAVTFAPHIGYFGWIIPLIVAIFEQKSFFVKLCAVQSLLSAGIMTASAVAFEFISRMVVDESNVPIAISLVGMLMSVLRVACAIAMVYLAYNGYYGKETDLPIITILAKKIIKYN